MNLDTVIKVRELEKEKLVYPLNTKKQELHICDKEIAKLKHSIKTTKESPQITSFDKITVSLLIEDTEKKLNEQLNLKESLCDELQSIERKIIEKNKEIKSLSKLIEKRDKARKIQTDKKEQNNLDEYNVY